MDARPARQRSGLQTFENCSGARVGRIFIIAADTAASTLENILSTGGYQTLPAAAASSLAEVDHDRSVVLGWGGGSGRNLPRPFKEIRLRTISRSAKTRAESEIRTRDAHESGRSRAGTLTKARLGAGRSTPRRTNAEKIS